VHLYQPSRIYVALDGAVGAAQQGLAETAIKNKVNPLFPGDGISYSGQLPLGVGREILLPGRRYVGFRDKAQAGRPRAGQKVIQIDGMVLHLQQVME